MGLTKIELSDPIYPRAVWSQLKKIDNVVTQFDFFRINRQTFGSVCIVTDTMKDLEILALLKIPPC